MSSYFWGGEKLSDNHFNSTLDEFDTLFARPAQKDEPRDIFSSSSEFELEDNQIFSSFATGKHNHIQHESVVVEEVPAINRVRQEFLYEDINQIYDAMVVKNEKSNRPKKKHHTFRNLLIIIICLTILGAGAWAYYNYSATIIDLFYTVKDYVLSLVVKIKELLQ